MSLNYNKVVIAGNLTRDPEIKFNTQTAIGKFGLAINSKYKTKGGEQREETTFVDVECFGRTAELVGQYLAKGRGCLIEGRLKFDQWDDKETGQKRSKLKVVADSVQFVGGKQEGGQAAAHSEATGPSVPNQAPIDDSEAPF